MSEENLNLFQNISVLQYHLLKSISHCYNYRANIFETEIQSKRVVNESDKLIIKNINNQNVSESLLLSLFENSEHFSVSDYIHDKRETQLSLNTIKMILSVTCHLCSYYSLMISLQQVLLFSQNDQVIYSVYFIK